MLKKIILSLLLSVIIFSPSVVESQVIMRGSRVAQTQPKLQRPKLISSPQQQWTGTVFAYASIVGQTDASPFITASGTTVTDGIVANNCLPFGTKVRFPKSFGTKEFVVQDRMAPRHSCQIFDIWHPNTLAARQFGRQVTVVEIY